MGQRRARRQRGARATRGRGRRRARCAGRGREPRGRGAGRAEVARRTGGGWPAWRRRGTGGRDVGPWAAAAGAGARGRRRSAPGAEGPGGAPPGTEARVAGHGARHGEGFSVVDVAFRHPDAAPASDPSSRHAGAADAPGSRFVVAAIRGKSEAFVRLYRGPGLRGAAGKLHGHERRPACLAFSADGRMLASGAPDNTVRVWNTGALVGGK